jgi:hypothetical protein
VTYCNQTLPLGVHSDGPGVTASPPSLSSATGATLSAVCASSHLGFSSVGPSYCNSLFLSAAFSCSNSSILALLTSSSAFTASISSESGPPPCKCL